MNDHRPTAVSATQSQEHLFAVVEPTGNGDATLDLARDVVARGGQASVLMLITDRVEDDIRGFASSEDLNYWTAEVRAIEQLTTYCGNRIGAEVPTHIVRIGRSNLVIDEYLTDDVTAVAVPGCLLEHKRLQRLVKAVDRTLIVTPDRAA